MANHKPLPALPASNETTTLSVDARNHRARLIHHFLTDIHEPGLEARRDGWVYVFEEVLDELGQHISAGDWLSRVKRGKKLKRKRTGEEADKNSRPVNVEKDNSIGSHKEEPVTEPAHAVKPLPSTPEPPLSPLKQLRQLAARPPSHEEPRGGHLVLCLAPHGTRMPFPTEDSGFDLVPANIGCAFSPGSFSLQDPGQDEVGTVLYGLDGLEGERWRPMCQGGDADGYVPVNVLDANLRLIGGTFTLKGVNSPMQHHLLFKVLKLAIYVHLSLLLEQNLLTDSAVQMKFPRPKMPASSPSTPTQLSAAAPKETKEVRIKARNTIIPSSFTNFFLKRNLSYRGAHTISVAGGRSGSLDLTVLPAPATDASEDPTPRKSTEGVHGLVGNLRLRRFSFMGDRRHSLRKSLHLTQEKREPPSQPFVMALKRIEGSKDLLSTSPGVSLGLPKPIVDLAEQERARAPLTEGQNPQRRRLKADERAALSSLLGWDGKDAEGRGMSGILGFVRQQEISVLCSYHVPSSTTTPTSTVSQPVTPSPSTSTTASESSELEKAQVGSSAFTTATTVTTSTVSTVSNIPSTGLSPCGKPHWLTFRYFSSNPSDDQFLGEWILDVAKGRNSPCTRPGCAFLKGQHEQRIIHDGVRIVVRVGEDDKVKEGDKEEEEESKQAEEDVEVWESCAVCNASTKRTKMSDGTYLFSFAKYLELLIYSPMICVLHPPLCEHTTPPLVPLTALPPPRLNIIRHFSTASADITFALSTVEDIFEVRVPRLQITRGVEKPTPPSPDSGRKPDSNELEEHNQKKMLRKEIRKWWEAVADHIDKIEIILNIDTPSQKSLPRLPSVDDAYEVFESSPPDSGASTPTPSTPFPLPPLPPTTPNPPSNDTPSDDIPKDSYSTTLSNMSTDSQASKGPTIPPKDNSEQLLAALRHNFQRIEQSLYAQLAKTPEPALNDVRRSFIATGRGTQKRLKAWQAKHLGAAKAKAIGELDAEEPQWWGKGCHVVPTGNIIVREHDWGSIIAHTLSTTDYQLEMANLSMTRSTSTGTQSTTSTPAVEVSNSSSSFFSVATSYRLFSLSEKAQPDPDQEDVVWNEPEQYSAAISRKDHGRDSTTFVSIRDVLRQNKPASEQSSGNPASRLASPGIAQDVGTPPSAFAKAKPHVGLSTESAGGQLNGQDSADNAGKILHDLENETPTQSQPASIKSELTSSSAFGNAHIRRGKASSIISAESRDSQATIGKENDNDNGSEGPTPQPSTLPPPLPPKDAPADDEKGKVPSKDEKEVVTVGDIAPPPPPPSKLAPPASEPPITSSGFASSLVTGIGSAVRYVLNSEPPSRVVSPAPPKKHHSLLLSDISAIDERPHIKYDWTIGKRMKFSCTVYYAKQFDLLRRRCGIHDVFLKSLSKSTNWAAEGGKSKSNFWKTSDDRFIIKTLVNAWNVADLQVLSDHAPSYFRYMDATASKPTVLAKLIGFYTIEVRNLETGTVQSKADLLVMENLFFGLIISKTFDLKGIQGRKVKTQGNGGNKTLFDGEWIEGQQRTLTLVRPYSKVILRDAIKSDAEFLAKSNIMDYSLLLGVDLEKKQIACGLVDTIGSYTFAKTLEYKAKQGLQSGKEITVVPPTEYQERFVNTLEGYFVACPDKWSKPLDESKIISDPNLLPSVL